MPITGAASDITFAERLAALRSQVGTEPLVSRVDAPVAVTIGCLVSQRVDGEAAHQPMSGRVVECWVDPATGEQGVVVVSAAGMNGVRSHRLRLEDCVLEPNLIGPASAPASIKAARGIWAALGASSSASLTRREERELRWATNLLHAVGSSVPTISTQGEPA